MLTKQDYIKAEYDSKYSTAPLLTAKQFMREYPGSLPPVLQWPIDEIQNLHPDVQPFIIDLIVLSCASERLYNYLGGKAPVRRRHIDDLLDKFDNVWSKKDPLIRDIRKLLLCIRKNYTQRLD